MNKKMFIVLFLIFMLAFSSTTLVSANAMSYYGLTTVGYGVANEDFGGSYWVAYRVEYTTQPYYTMDQIGATFWSLYNTCDGETNWESWRGSSDAMSGNVRDSYDIWPAIDYQCLEGPPGRMSYASHWWQTDLYEGDGDPQYSNETFQQTSLADMPITNMFYAYVERMYQVGIIGQDAIDSHCSQSGYFCPTHSVTRGQMASYLERGMRGSNYVFPSAVGIFDDVPSGSWNEAMIEQLYADQVTAGCWTSPLRFCPDSPVTRAQMAVFLLVAEHGSGYTPPPIGSGTGFADVPSNYWAARWIKQLAAEGITGGCATNPPRFCPESPTTHAQMAVFLHQTFAP